MTNIYGAEPELAGWAPQEDTREKCPYCHGRHTQFIDFELTHERHFCWDCEVDFSVAYEWVY